MTATTIKNIPVSQISGDHRYQRPLNEKRVRTMVDNFDPHLFGPLDAAKRTRGKNVKYVVFEGQHRLAVAKAMGMKTVRCVVHDDIDVRDEATLFVKLHTTRKNLSPIDRFNARVFAQEPLALKIKAAIDDSGFSVHKNEDAASIMAITAAEKSYRIYGESIFRDALGLIGRIWYAEDGATSGPLITGMCRFLAQYGDRLDAEHVENLERVSPSRVLDAARSSKQPTISLAVAADLKKRTGMKGTPRRIGGAS